MPKPLAFPKSRRLTRTAEFERVRRENKVWKGSLITLGIAAAADEKDPMRAGIIASRRVGNAVTRNRTRRRIREIVRKHQHKIISGVWLVIITSSRGARASYTTLEDEYLRLASRASILAP